MSKTNTLHHSLSYQWTTTKLTTACSLLRWVLFIILLITAVGVKVIGGVEVIVVVVVVIQQKQTRGSVCTTQGHLQLTHFPEKVTFHQPLCIKATLLRTYFCNKWSNLVHFLRMTYWSRYQILTQIYKLQNYFVHKTWTITCISWFFFTDTDNTTTNKPYILKTGLVSRHLPVTPHWINTDISSPSMWASDCL